ncbi:MAG: thiamine diphosphokinase [Chloroflexi bacterium]|nr:MAG: thiamine diphosphokinase [Chloroflexota bacterium]
MVAPDTVKRVLLFANGDIADGPMVRRAVQSGAGATIVAADGGARIAHHFGLSVDVLIGDMDSLTADEVTSITDGGATVQRYAPEKDETDLELALLWSAKHNINWIRIIGGAGGRLDHTIANLYLLALPQLADCDVRMVMARQEIYLVYPGAVTINGAVGDTISLIPMNGAAHGIRTKNLKYPLHGETLEFGPARGVSNVMLEAHAYLSLEEGLLLLIHTIGRA